MLLVLNKLPPVGALHHSVVVATGLGASTEPAPLKVHVNAPVIEAEKEVDTKM